MQKRFRGVFLICFVYKNRVHNLDKNNKKTHFGLIL